MTNTRYAAVAGAFYPGLARELQTAVEHYLQDSRVQPTDSAAIKALIVPHAGYIYSGPIAGTAYRQLDSIDKDKHWKIMLIGPAHRYPVRGVSVCAFDQYQTPLGMILVSDTAKDMARQVGFIPQADLQEHSLEVQLPFLQMQLKSFELIPIVIGNAPPEQLATFLKPYLDDDTLLIISTDLSHFFDYDKAVARDALTNQAIAEMDLLSLKAHGDACGIVGVMTGIHLAQSLGWQVEQLDYRNSGDTAGPKDRVVGYGAFSFRAAS